MQGHQNEAEPYSGPGRAKRAKKTVLAGQGLCPNDFPT
jgi:hypothetical protein